MLERLPGSVRDLDRKMPRQDPEPASSRNDPKKAPPASLWSPSSRRLVLVVLASFMLLVVLVGAVLVVLLSGIWMRNLEATSDGDEVIRIQRGRLAVPRDAGAPDAD